MPLTRLKWYSESSEQVQVWLEYNIDNQGNREARRVIWQNGLNRVVWVRVHNEADGTERDQEIPITGGVEDSINLPQSYRVDPDLLWPETINAPTG
jgi:hypothetical protein